MKRNKREHGRILSVETLNRGDSLAADVAAGATSITVNDAGDFEDTDPDKPPATAANPLGWLLIGAQTVAYIDCDDDTGVITLADPLAAAGEEGDPVHVWSDLYGEVVDYQLALVELDGEYDNPDPVAAEVAEGVGDLPEGDRGKAGESCTLLRVAEDEWEVVGVGGRSRKSRGLRAEWDDTYVLTVADITAGVATVPLTHRPVDEWLIAVLAGVPQQPNNYALNYDAQTITWTLPNWAKVGYRIWVHYAYRKGVATAVISELPTLVGPGTAFATTSGTVSSVALPSGVQAGDLLVLAITDWDGVASCSDPRMSLYDGGGAMLVYAGYHDDSSTPLAISAGGSGQGAAGALVALRGAQPVTSAQWSASVVDANVASPTVPNANAAICVAQSINTGFTVGGIALESGSEYAWVAGNGTGKASAAIAWWTSSAARQSPDDLWNFSRQANAHLLCIKIGGM